MPSLAVLGGLLSAHLFTKRAGMEVEPGWPCTGPLLRLAEDVARRLLPGTVDWHKYKDYLLKRLKNFHDEFLSHCSMVSNAAGLINVIDNGKGNNLFLVKKKIIKLSFSPFQNESNLANKNKITACCITFLDFWQEKLKINLFLPQIIYNMLWLVECNQMKVYRST